ncbi:MAG TPA: ABC transporter ATP-binding protein [Candidatus Nanopelagicales bacterium]
MTTAAPAPGIPAPTSVAAAIEVRGLVKHFGSLRVLDRLDLTVAPGEVHGFLGPNGAGKTTTLRILLGMLRADAGALRVLGADPWHDAVALHRRLAYVPGDVTLWPNLTGGEVIDMLGRMRGGLDRGRRDQLIERFDLDPTKRGRTYSKGNRQKVALVAAVASDAELLLLDEPTAGLDPLMDATFREHIAEVRAAGRTVLLSSHVLSEVEALCDRVSIIRAGSVVETGSLAQLRHLTRTSVVAEVGTVPAGLEHLPGVHDLVIAGHRVTASVESSGLGLFMSALSGGGLQALTTQPPTLEELFLRHYREELAPEQVGLAPDRAAAPGQRPGRRGRRST